MENQNNSPDSAQNDDRPQGLPEPIYAASDESNNPPMTGVLNNSDHAVRNQSQMGVEAAPSRATGGAENPDADGGDDEMDDEMDDDMDDEDMPDSENPDRPDLPGQPMA